MMNDEMRSINCVESSISTESMLNCFWPLASGFWQLQSKTSLLAISSMLVSAKGQ
jgi:hypothetical protein